jgi:hypothetical protein
MTVVTHPDKKKKGSHVMTIISMFELSHHNQAD